MWKSKKSRFLVIILLIISCLGIGGKLYMDKREEQKEKDLLAVEKQSVKVLKNTFMDIAEIDIERTGYNSMTGSYRILVTMKNMEGKQVDFSYGFVKDSKEIDTYVLSDREVQKKGITKNNIKVIYSNGEEEEI